MSRQEKKTRIRVVPPKLQLRGQDALTGSYPTKVRFSTDGRTGNYKVGYNDVQTVVFGTRSNGTSWQDNLVAYWTMQRNIPNTGFASNFALESETTDKNSTFPFLDFELADDPIVSGIEQYGFKEEFAFSGKGYNVNVNTGQPTDNIIFPIPEVNKSYEFYPKYSVFGQTETKLFITNPLLVQNQDSNKTACAFDGNWNDGPSAFTVAGWFKINDIIGESNSWTLLKGPQRSNVTFDVDYAIGLYSPNLNEKKFYLYIQSGSGNAYVEQSGVYYDTELFNTWFHVAISYDGKTDRAPDPDPKGTLNNDSLKIYINAKKIDVTPISILGGFNGFNSGSFPTYGVGFLEYWYGGLGDQQITGSIAEAAFFNRELTSSEIADIYYSRVPLNKKRRVIAGTSIDLDNDPYPVDAGEYMTNFNRDGMLVTGSIVKGVGDNPEWVHFSPGQEMQPFHDEQQFAADAKGATVQNPFFATGSAETLVGEGFNSPLWSKNKIEIPIPVVADAKFKLPKAKHTTGATTVLTYDSPMGYYNFEKNVWEPVGIGIAIDASSLELYQQYLTVGFFNGFITTQSYVPGFEEQIGSVNINQAHTIGCCGSDLGFPYHPKYHATSSQTLDMSQYINEPFLLEKAILELGPVTFEVGNINLTRANNVISGSVSTFFLLNQRKNQNFQYSKQQIAFVTGSNAIVYVSASVPADTYLNKDDAFSLTPTRVDTIRDIVGYSQLYSFAYTVLDTVVKRNNIPGTFSPVTSSIRNLIPFKNNDILIENGNVSSISGVNYNQYLPIFSMSMCTPAYAGLKLAANIAANIGSTNITTKYYPGDGGRDRIYISFDGTRTGLNTTQLSTRGLNNDLFFSENIEKSVSFPDQFIYPKEKYKENPYVLYPQDKLILGCQSPVSQDPAYTTIYDPASTNAECVLTLSQSINVNNPKLILYGSYIRENKEYNDGTNQLLSSETIHEVIE